MSSTNIAKRREAWCGSRREEAQAGRSVDLGIYRAT
jgi:hypothetical protein